MLKNGRHKLLVGTIKEIKGSSGLNGLFSARNARKALFTWLPFPGIPGL